MMKEIKVYDPPMCCSSGVCGASVNPELVRFSNDLKELERQGVSVQRFNLSSDPAAFVAEPLVKETLAQEGNDCLPLILADGKIIAKGGYPLREEMMKLAGIESTQDATKEDVGTEAGSDCGPECSCNCAPSGKKVKTIVSSVVLIAVLSILGVKFTNAKTEEKLQPEETGSAPFATGIPAAETPVAAPEKPVSILEKLQTLSDLNSVALSQDAVLVLIPKAGTTDPATETAMQNAQTTLKRSSLSLGLYTLADSSPDYPMISEQANPPAILVAAKGRGMLFIRAEGVTESKILQAFMAASSSGGCGTGGGCGPVGCN